MIKIFFAALLIRWTYAFSLYLFMGDAGLEGVDSTTYSAQAAAFAQAILAGTVHGSHWLGHYPYNMPLFQWLTTLPFLLIGKAGTIGYVAIQGAFDSGTCVLIYKLARLLSPRFAWPAAIFAIFNPTQIVLSGLFYTDTPFTFFVTLSLYLAATWIIRPSLPAGTLLGCALGLAALIRVSIAPWAFFAAGLLAGYSLWRWRSLKLLAGPAITIFIFLASLTTIAVRNFDQYGTYELSPQGGDYLAIWIVPLAKEAQDRTPFFSTVDQVVKSTQARFGPPSANPFEQSRRFQQIGWELLKSQIKWQSLVVSWASGIFINLASPAHLLSPPVSLLPRTGFYETAGSSFLGKVYNYAFKSGNALYSDLLILGIVGVTAVRILQVIGLYELLKHKDRWPSLLLSASFIVFLLLLNGPIASPKYRLPLEPLFNILSAAGVQRIRAYDRRRYPGSLADTPTSATKTSQSFSQLP